MELLTFTETKLKQNKLQKFKPVVTYISQAKIRIIITIVVITISSFNISYLTFGLKHTTNIYCLIQTQIRFHPTFRGDRPLFLKE